MAEFAGSVINQVSTDVWQILTCPGAHEVIFQIANAAIVYQYGDGIGRPVFSDQTQPLLPGFHVRDQRPCDAVRFRSLKAGTPAAVSIETA